MERLRQEATGVALGHNDKSLTRPVTVGVDKTGQINNMKQVKWINICKQLLRLLIMIILLFYSLVIKPNQSHGLNTSISIFKTMLLATTSPPSLKS